MTGLSIAYGASKFLMGSVSDRSNPKYFLPLGLLLSAAIIFASGTVTVDLLVARAGRSCCRRSTGGCRAWAGRRAARRWCTGGARRSAASPSPPGTSRTTSAARSSPTSRCSACTLFNDWGAKFYFNAVIAAVVAVGVFFLLRDTPQSCGLPPVEEYKNDYPPDYSADHERVFTFREIFFGHVLNNRYLWAIAVANAFVYFVRYGVVNWIPTYLETAKGFSFKQSSIGVVALRVGGDPGHDRLRLDLGPVLQGPARAGQHPVHGADARRGRRLLAQPARARCGSTTRRSSRSASSSTGRS